MCVVCIVSRWCGTCNPSQVYVTTHQLGHSHGLFSEDKVVQIGSGRIFAQIAQCVLRDLVDLPTELEIFEGNMRLHRENEEDEVYEESEEGGRGEEGEEDEGE